MTDIALVKQSAQLLKHLETALPDLLTAERSLDELTELVGILDDLYKGIKVLRDHCQDVLLSAWPDKLGSITAEGITAYRQAKVTYEIINQELVKPALVETITMKLDAEIALKLGLIKDGTVRVNKTEFIKIISHEYPQAQ